MRFLTEALGKDFAAPMLVPFLALVLVSEAGAVPPAADADPVRTFFGTATVQERPIDTATASVTVIDRVTIESLGAETVAEVLRFVPGVEVTTQGARGGITTAQVRGGDPNFTLVLLDGVALNDGTYQVGEVFNFEGLPVSAIERIEIVRGPLSSHYGSSGLAGAIHIITRTARSTVDPSSPGDHGLEVELGGGNAEFGRAGLRWAGRGKRGDVFLDLSGQREDGRVADERFEQAHLQGRGRLVLGPGTAVEIAGRWTNWEGDDYPEASGGPRLGSGELRRADNREGSLQAVLHLDGAESMRHRFTVAAYRHELERESPAIGFLVPPSVEDTTFTRTRLGWSTTLDPRPGLQVSAGADVVREMGDNTSTLLLPAFLGGRVTGDYRLTRTTPAAFAELVASRGVWTLELGTRIDWPEDGEVQVSPRLGVRVRAGERGTVLRASVGRAFKLPSFFALASPRALGGNRALAPETTIGADLGVEKTFADGRLDGGLTLFAQRYENLVDFDFATFLHINRGEVEAEGVEMFLRWRPRPAWQIAADATWQQVEDAELGDVLRHRPDWIVGLRVGWRPREGLAAHLDGRWVSGFRDEQIPVPDRSQVDDHLLVGATLQWSLNAALRLRVRAENLLDETYEARIGFPGAGRAVRLAVRWSPP